MGILFIYTFLLTYLVLCWNYSLSTTVLSSQIISCIHYIHKQSRRKKKVAMKLVCKKVFKAADIQYTFITNLKIKIYHWNYAITQKNIKNGKDELSWKMLTWKLTKDSFIKVTIVWFQYNQSDKQWFCILRILLSQHVDFCFHFIAVTGIFFIWQVQY